MSVMIGIDPHKALHAVCAIDRHESRVGRGRGALGTATTRPVARLGGAVRVADVGDRVRGRARLSARSALARPRRAGGGCAGDVVVAGAAVGVGALEQERRQRRPRGGGRCVAGTVVGGGARRGSRLGVALVGQSPVRHRACARSRACSRLHALVSELVAGGIGKEVVVNQGEQLLATIAPVNAVQRQRLELAHELLDEIRVLDAATQDIQAAHRRGRHRVGNDR